MSGNDSDDEKQPVPRVGYGRPPVDRRFKPGVSGNPKGRPRKSGLRRDPTKASTSLDDLILREANRPIELRENGRPVKMTVMEAAMRSIEASMLKGNHRAQEHFIHLVKGAQARAQEQTLALGEAIAAMKAKWLEISNACETAGSHPPNPAPHPDDISFDARDGSVSIIGPIDNIELEQEQVRIAMIEEMKGRLSRIELAQRNSPEHAFLYEDEHDLGTTLIERMRDVFPPPDIRRAKSFDLDAWLAKRNARAKARGVLNLMPTFDLAKQCLADAEQIPISWLGGDNLMPAVWNRGENDGDDEMDFATLAILWTRFDAHYTRLKAAVPTTDWGPRASW